MDWTKKHVLITGATGSFGRKFVEAMLREYRPAKLIVFSRDELKQSEMRKEFHHPSVRYFIGDVRDQQRLYRALDGVQIVVHAAALKQVPTAEYNPFEVVQTNIIGAENLINASIDRGVEKLIALSSDKAVNPINLYGATKLCSDKLFIAGNSYSGAGKARFSVVRYGNVLGSRGSVVTLFEEAKERGVLPITDARMTRFWITLDQGVRFVIRCLETMRGGEIFIPKLPSMKIVDLARAVAPNCRHETVGIRPGEKLHEILIPRDEIRRTLEFDDMYVIEPDFPWWGKNSLIGGRRLPDDFEYSSDKNSKWLNVEELREMLENDRRPGSSSRTVGSVSN